MDAYVTLASPLRSVFACLADPAHLSDWLPEVGGAVPASLAGTGAEFSLTVHAGGTPLAASCEMTAFEPPWLVGYRLFVGPRAVSLRVTCTVHGTGTRVHVHQPDGPAAMTIDLARLTRAFGLEAEGTP